MMHSFRPVPSTMASYASSIPLLFRGCTTARGGDRGVPGALRGLRKLADGSKVRRKGWGCFPYMLRAEKVLSS